MVMSLSGLAEVRVPQMRDRVGEGIDLLGISDAALAETKRDGYKISLPRDAHFSEHRL